MNKRLWIIPIALILLTSAYIAYLNLREIDPEDYICATSVEDVVTVTEADALRIVDSGREAFEACYQAFSSGLPYDLPEHVLRADEAAGALVLILEERPGLTVSVGRGAQLPPALDSRGGQGYNAVRVCSELLGEWRYCVDFVCELTPAKTLTERLQDALSADELAQLAPDAWAHVVYLLVDTEQAPETTAHSTSRYAICAQLERSDGTTLTAVFDAKRIAFLGIAAD